MPHHIKKMAIKFFRSFEKLATWGTNTIQNSMSTCSRGNFRHTGDSLACKLTKDLSTTASASLVENPEHLMSSLILSNPLPEPIRIAVKRHLKNQAVGIKLVSDVVPLKLG